MKTFLTILLIAVAGFATRVHSEKPAEAPVAVAKDVSPDEAEALIKGKPGVFVIDVRTADEFTKGHIAGAKNVDFLGDDFEKQLAALDASKPLLVHCAAGNRSSQAVAQMAALKKFGTIYHLKAGFSGWVAAKKPVEK